jgi:hypothetical protein
MPFAAISYGVQPGHEDEIAEIFSARNFRRASSPVLRDESGAEVGRLQATGLFIQLTEMVRVIQFTGNLAAVGRHMASQPGVHEAEQRLAPYLAVSRDTSTVEGFKAHFSRSVMTPVQQHVRRDDIATAMIAIRHQVQPDSTPGLTAALAAALPVSATDGPVLGTAAFVRESTLVRVYQCEGELTEAAAHVAAWPGRIAEAARLRPFLSSTETVEEDPTAARDRLLSGSMRCISQLSVPSLPLATSAG